MLLFEHKQRAWAAVSSLVLVTALCVYVLIARHFDDWPAGGSLVGLWFGIIGSAMMVFAALIAVRRRFPTLRLGSGEWWLRAHLWIGTLSFVFILLHSGFRLGGPLEQWLWLSFATVVLSGFFLVFVQQILPNYLTARVPSETFAEQVPYLCRRLIVQSDDAVSNCYGPLPVDCEPVRDAIYDIANPARYGQAKSRQKEYVQLATRIYGYAPEGKLNRGFPVEEKEEAPAARPKAGAASPAATPAMTAAATSHGPTRQPSAPKPQAVMSPLEKMRAQQAAKAAAAAGETPAASPAATPSPTTSAADPAADGTAPPADKPMSKMELARAQMAAKKAGGTAPSAAAPASADGAAPQAEGSKPLSKLELAKAQAAAKKAASTGAVPQAADADAAPASHPGNGEPAADNGGAIKADVAPAATEIPPNADEKLLSKLELARAQALGKRNGDTQPAVASPAPPTESAVPVESVAAPQPVASTETKPLSKIELARQQMLAKKAAAVAPVADTATVPVQAAVAPPEAPAAPQVHTPPAAAAVAAKPLSKIELMRAQAAAKKPAGSGGTAISPETPAATPSAPVPPSPVPAPASRPAPAVARRTTPAEKPQLPLPRAEDLLEFHLKVVRPFLEFDEQSFTGTAAQAVRWKASLATAVRAEQAFLNMRRTLPVDLHAALDELERCCNERRDYRFQQRIHRWLHGCLLLHVPASTALIVFFLIHVLTALRVIPF